MAAFLLLAAFYSEMLQSVGLTGRFFGMQVVFDSLGHFATAWLPARLIALGIGRLSLRGRPVPRLLVHLINESLFGGALFATSVLLLGRALPGALATSGLLLALLGFAIRNVAAPRGDG